MAVCRTLGDPIGRFGRLSLFGRGSSRLSARSGTGIGHDCIHAIAVALRIDGQRVAVLNLDALNTIQLRAVHDYDVDVAVYHDAGKVGAVAGDHIPAARERGVLVVVVSERGVGAVSEGSGRLHHVAAGVAACPAALNVVYVLCPSRLREGYQGEVD